VNGRLVGRGEAAQFRPDQSRFAFFRSGVALFGQITACAECGLIASELHVNELRDHLRFQAKPEVQKWLDEKPETSL
jgi:hypothetical protein